MGRLEPVVTERVAADPFGLRLGRHEQARQPRQAEPFLCPGHRAEEARRLDWLPASAAHRASTSSQKCRSSARASDQDCCGVLSVAEAALPERRPGRHDQGHELSQVAPASAVGAGDSVTLSSPKSSAKTQTVLALTQARATSGPSHGVSPPRSSGSRCTTVAIPVTAPQSRGEPARKLATRWSGSGSPQIWQWLARWVQAMSIMGEAQSVRLMACSSRAIARRRSSSTASCSAATCCRAKRREPVSSCSAMAAARS